MARTHTVNFTPRRQGKTLKSFSDWYLGAATEVDGELVKNTGSGTMLVVRYDPHYKTYSFISREIGGQSYEDFGLSIAEAMAEYRKLGNMR